MNPIERYVQAATRENTRRSYQAAVEHFEVSWGGFLPATADSIARYLADHAQSHALSTLKQRLASTPLMCRPARHASGMRYPPCYAPGVTRPCC